MALVTVLAIVLLMSVLVMSFFEMAKSELNASLKDSDNVKARSFADAAVNIVISQIREATTQKSTSDEYAPWSSQPGAIRVYQPYGDLKAIYKLYSSSRMLADSLQQLERDDFEEGLGHRARPMGRHERARGHSRASRTRRTAIRQRCIGRLRTRGRRGPRREIRSKGSGTRKGSTGWCGPGRPAELAAPADASALALSAGRRHDRDIEQGGRLRRADRRERADQGEPDCRADRVLD